MRRFVIRGFVLVGVGVAIAGCVPVQQYDAYGQPIASSEGPIFGQSDYGAGTYSQPGYAAPGYAAPGYVSPGYLAPG